MASVYIIKTDECGILAVCGTQKSTLAEIASYTKQSDNYAKIDDADYNEVNATERMIRASLRNNRTTMLYFYANDGSGQMDTMYIHKMEVK